MTRNRLLLFSLLIAAVLVGLWRFGSEADEDSVTALPTRAAPLEQDDSALLDMGGVRSELSREEREAVLEETPEAASKEPDIDDAQATIAFWGRLVAADDGQPVAGATITHNDGHDPVASAAITHNEGHEFHGSGRKARFEDAHSDAQGLVELEHHTELRTAARVDADGFGPVVFLTDAEHGTPERALELTLQRAAILVVRIVDEGALPLAGIQVQLTTPSYAITRPEGTSLFGTDPSWSKLTGSDGTCVFDQLPPEAPLAVSAWREGKQLYREPADLVLEPGKRRELAWSIGSGAELLGWALDQHGDPIVKRELWLTRNALNARPERSRFYFYSSDERKIVARTHTDARGHFAFEDVTPGTWYVGPSPNHRHQNELNPNWVAPVAKTIEVLPGGIIPELELRLTRGLFIHGKITYPGDEPPRHVSVSSYSELGSLSAHVDELDFLLGPVEPIVHSLHANPMGEYTDSERVEAHAGDQEILLELGLGGQLAGHFVDGRTGERCEAALVVSCESTGHLSLGLNPKPEFSLKGLEPGAYDLTASTPEGLVGVLRGVQVEAGASQDDLEIRLDPGAKLRVRYSGSSTYAQYQLQHEGAVVAANGLRSGTTELEVVPAGTIVVRMSFGVTLKEERSVSCEVGSETEAAFELE